MRTWINAGIIGCGVISEIYCQNLQTIFGNTVVRACADIKRENSERLADKYKIAKVYSVEELLADQEIDLVLNLTIPAEHEAVSRRILLAGKHLYSEKPFALSVKGADELLSLAAEKKRMVCAAPDTVLGPGLMTAKKAIEEGWIGRPVAATANMMTHGVETWHKNPSFYYQKGAGPMMDMGPYYFSALVSLLGPIRKIFCFSNRGKEEREIYSEPLKGSRVKVEVDTNYTGVLSFESGVTANITTSFEAWSSNLPQFEIYGTEGVLMVPDPNTFGGPVKLLRGSDMLECARQVRFGNEGGGAGPLWKEIPLTEGVLCQNLRGLAVSEMAEEILHGTKRRITEPFIRHVTEAVLGAVSSTETGNVYEMKSTWNSEGSI